MAANGTNGETKDSIQARATEGIYETMPDTYATMGGNIPALVFNIAQLGDHVPRWNPIFPNRRDYWLREIAKSEPGSAAALYTLKTRFQSLNYTLNGPPRAKNKAKEMLKYPGVGDSLSTLIAKGVDDLLSTDNGFFVEIIASGKADKPRGSKPIKGFAHIDSRQCWRTFDPEFPVIYTNPQTGQMHKLYYDRVIMNSDNPQPVEVARNIGFCAVSRALRWTKIMRDTLTYRDEKIGGRFTRAIGAMKGITDKQFKSAMQSTDEQAEGRGFAVYKGIPFLFAPGLEAGADIDIILKDLASIPDGFDWEKEVTLYIYMLAFCYGVDAREFWPATQTGATKGDATVQNMKSRGKTIGMITETLEGVVRAVIPESVEFEFDYVDDEADEQAARIHKMQTETFSIYVDKGAISPEQMRALGEASGILSAEVLAGVGGPVESDDSAQPEDAPGLPAPTDQTNPPPTEPPAGEGENRRPFAKQITPRVPMPPPGVDLLTWSKAFDFDSFIPGDKAYTDTRDAFIADFNTLLVTAMESETTRRSASGQLRAMLNRYGRALYLDGLEDGGIDDPELEESDKDTIATLLSTQSGYVTAFMGNLFGDGISPAVAAGKAEQWFNGSLQPFYDAGLVASGSNPLMEFDGVDGAKPCEDCVRLKSQRHRLKEWLDKELNPPYGAALKCGAGKKCRHKLVRVKGRARGAW